MDYAAALKASNQEIERLRRDLRIAGNRAVLEARRMEALKVELARVTAKLRMVKLENQDLHKECDQYQAKLTEVWAELEDLRARLLAS